MMSHLDVALHEATELLQKPSFIKQVPSPLIETSGSWLIDKLSELSTDLSSETLNEIYSMIENYWLELTDIQAYEEIIGFSESNTSSPILDGYVNRQDPEYGIPSGFILSGGCLEPDDETFLKELICETLDSIYPTTLDRFTYISEYTDWKWIYTTDFEDEMEVTIADVAITVAIEMLGTYLQKLLTQSEYKMSGTLAFDIDEVHQAHFLAQQLKTSENTQTQLLEVQRAVSKQTLTSRASKGGSANAQRYRSLRNHVLKLFLENKTTYKSIRQASIELAPKARDYAKTNGLPILAPTNAQRTIYDWLRISIKNK